MATRLCWLGHSCLLLESDGKRILIDPFLTDNPAAATSADKVSADFILVSHGHGDHVGDTVAIAQRTGAAVIANYEMSGWFQKQGVKTTHGQQHGGGHHYPFGHVKLTLAFHGSALPDGSYGGNPCGFLITFKDGTRIYDAADTGLFGDMRLIGEEGVDLALLPLGDNFTMGPDDALRAVKLIQPRQVVPIHYNTWELIAQDAGAWAERVRKETQTEPVILKPGDWLDVKAARR
jgi:L-ascorbate metabolism protein UlaG (beta-lactamase superfamily)